MYAFCPDNSLVQGPEVLESRTFVYRLPNSGKPSMDRGNSAEAPSFIGHVSSEAVFQLRRIIRLKSYKRNRVTV